MGLENRRQTLPNSWSRLMRKASSRSSDGTTVRKTVVRCAIYTRKSSEEGLEQDFNSLDAQREACEAYVASQRSEGWIASPKMYDDGGFSGGTMERPVLKALLADIREDWSTPSSSTRSIA